MPLSAAAAPACPAGYSYTGSARDRRPPPEGPRAPSPRPRRHIQRGNTADDFPGRRGASRPINRRSTRPPLRPAPPPARRGAGLPWRWARRQRRRSAAAVRVRGRGRHRRRAGGFPAVRGTVPAGSEASPHGPCSPAFRLCRVRDASRVAAPARLRRGALRSAASPPSVAPVSCRGRRSLCRRGGGERQVPRCPFAARTPGRSHSRALARGTARVRRERAALPAASTGAALGQLPARREGQPRASGAGQSAVATGRRSYNSVLGAAVFLISIQAASNSRALSARFHRNFTPSSCTVLTE